AGRHRAPGGAGARVSAHRSRDPDVSGAADLGEPRTRGARYVPARDRDAAAGWCEVRSDHVPLARGPDREAHLPGERVGGRDMAGIDAEAGRSRRRRDSTESTGAKRKAARHREARMSTDFEYAIKKDVRNNPIVREIDEARQRQIRRSLA